MNSNSEVKYAFQAVLDPYSPVDTGGFQIVDEPTRRDRLKSGKGLFGLAKTARGMGKSRISARTVAIVSYSPDSVVNETDDTIWVNNCEIEEIVDYLDFLQGGGSGTDLARRVLPGLHELDGICLTEVDFGDFDLFSASFKDAQLSGSDFTCSVIADTNFSGADLTRCDFTHSVVRDTDFSNTTVVDATFVKVYGRDSDFTNANLTDSNFGFSSWDGSTFENADLRGARFDKVDLDKIDMTGVIMEENVRFTDRVRYYARMWKWLGIGQRVK